MGIGDGDRFVGGGLGVVVAGVVGAVVIVVVVVAVAVEE
jgi:hypothetical protein